MQIQLRVRVNDVSEVRKATQFIHNGFILFDNCTEVKYGDVHECVSRNEFKKVTLQAETINEARNFELISYSHSESSDAFAEVIYMVRDIDCTEERIANDPKLRGLTRVDYKIPRSNPDKNQDHLIESPYHYNVVEWKDRTTGKRYRLIFDTIVFLLNDNGQTLRKIKG